MNIEHIFDYNHMYIVEREREAHYTENGNDDVFREIGQLAEQNNCKLTIHHFISDRSRPKCLYEDFSVPNCPSHIRHKLERILAKRYLTHLRVKDKVFQDKEAIERELYEARKKSPNPTA
nr:MAG TPA: hypothetical protein [Caudoviricetes sp.]